LPAEPDESFQVPLGQEPNKGEKSGNGTFLLVVLLLLFLLIAGALIYIFFIRNRRYAQNIPSPQMMRKRSMKKTWKGRGVFHSGCWG